MTDMLATMKFVSGAVSKTSLVAELKHFQIKDGSIKGFNGVIALQSPIDFNVNCMPLAVPLVNAIARCEDVMSLRLSDTGRLRIESGPFKTFIECHEEAAMPDLEPVGETVAIDGVELMKAINALFPFIGSDASRIWVNGILLKGQSAFATNNVCLAQYWIGNELPLTANIPMEAIREMVRIKAPPLTAQISEHSITFHYEDGRWLKTQLYSTEWPDLEPILARELLDHQIVPPTLGDALETIKPFLEKDTNVYLRGGFICTAPVDDIGASYYVEGLRAEGIYKYEMLKLVVDTAQSFDLSQYPNPCPFYAERMRGVILGMRP